MMVSQCGSRHRIGRACVIPICEKRIPFLGATINGKRYIMRPRDRDTRPKWSSRWKWWSMSWCFLPVLLIKLTHTARERRWIAAYLIVRWIQWASICNQSTRANRVVRQKSLAGRLSMAYTARSCWKLLFFPPHMIFCAMKRRAVTLMQWRLMTMLNLESMCVAFHLCRITSRSSQLFLRSQTNSSIIF